MNLEQKLAELKRAARKTAPESELERQLEYLRRLERAQGRGAVDRVALPAHRVPHRIEEYVEGQVETNRHGEYFAARQALPFGRPYGKLRISDLSAANLSPLDLLLGEARLPSPERLAYLDTETTGLAGGTGTCAFLIGVGLVERSSFVVRQLFLRDYPEEKAMLASLADLLAEYDGVVTFNGKTFDLPLLETRYALARLQSPFTRLVHLDLLHPARRLWKLRLESCQLAHLEREILKLRRSGDVDGWEIPQIYFDYLRTGNARGLQPVFFHNSLDIVTLAALTVEMARACAEDGIATLESSLDLFSLSGILERAGIRERSIAACRRALEAGLPDSIEPRALWRLAGQHKRERQYEQAAEIWIELARREGEWSIEALEELAIYHEHRVRDPRAALEAVERAIERLKTLTDGYAYNGRFVHRWQRLRRKAGQANLEVEVTQRFKSVNSPLTDKRLSS